MTRLLALVFIITGCVFGAVAAQQTQLKTTQTTAKKTTNQQTAAKKVVAKKSTTSKINKKPLPKGTKADFVFVDKSARKMYLKKKGKVLRVYHIALGDSPKGHKTQEGDEKTPEGLYTLDWKNENSIAHRSIHISYPNSKDKARAKKLGVKPGGAIMIHGQMNGYGHLAPIMQQRDWTDGCIAVTDKEMDEIMDLVKVGTKIKIVW